MIVIIVQPDLAPRNDLRSLCQLRHSVERGLVRQHSFMRMNPDGRVNKRILFRQQDAAVKVDWPIAIADRNNGLNASLARSRNHLFAIGIKTSAIEVAVGVYVHVVGVGSRSPAEGSVDVSGWQNHIRRCPILTAFCATLGWDSTAANFLMV